MLIFVYVVVLLCGVVCVQHQMLGCNYVCGSCLRESLFPGGNHECIPMISCFVCVDF